MSFEAWPTDLRTKLVIYELHFGLENHQKNLHIYKDFYLK